MWITNLTDLFGDGVYYKDMKKYTSFLFVFTLFIILLCFNANSTSADNCASGELFNTTTGKACSTAKAVVCPAGDLFSLVTGQRCTAV